MLALVLAAQLALAPRTPISTEVIRSAPGLQTRPAIASNGEELFAVWEHRGDVLGSRIRLDGTAVDTNLGISLQPTWVYDMGPSVVWNGETWVVVFFSGPQPWPLGAKLVEVNRGGEVITELRLIPDRDIGSIDVAWNGSHYLVVWREGSARVRGQLFDRAFAEAGEELALADAGREVATASSGGGFLVAWTDDAGTHTRAVSSDGAPGATARIGDAASDVDIASNGISYAVVSRDVVAVDSEGVAGARASLPFAAEVALAASGANWIVAWSSSFQLFLAELDAGMRFVEEPWRWPLPAGKSSPAIALAGNRALLLFSDFSSNQYEADIRSAFIDEPSTSRLVSSGLMHQEIADAAWSASTLGVLWYESERQGAGLRFGELSAGGALLRGEGIPLADGVYARLASNGSEFAAASMRNSHVEVDLLPRMQTVVLDDFQANYPAIASDGRDYYAVWTGSGNLHGRRIGADGSLGEVHTFPKRIAGSFSLVHDIVWAGDKYVVLTHESLGMRQVTYTVVATDVSAAGVPGASVVLESATAYFPGVQGRLGWNGKTLLYARSGNDPTGAFRVREGLHGADVVLLPGGYADLEKVVWDRGAWSYLVNTDGGWRLLRAGDAGAIETQSRPRLAVGAQAALLTSVRLDRIPNHVDQSVRRGFVTFVKLISRRRAVRQAGPI